MIVLLVSGGTDVDLQRFRTGLEFVGERAVMAEETVLEHGLANHAREYCTRMKAYTHLYGEILENKDTNVAQVNEANRVV